MAPNELFKIVTIAVTSCLLYCCTSQPVNISQSPLHQLKKKVDPDTIVGVLRERAEKITTIKSTLSMSIQNRHLKQSKKIKGFIAICKPGRIRFKGFTFLGMELFDLVIKDNHFQLFLPGKNELYQGNREDVYNSTIALPLLPDDITSIFYSDMYDSPHLDCWEENDYYLLSLPQEEDGAPLRSKKLWLEKKNLTIVTMEIYNGDELDTKYSFDNYKLIGENYFPYTVEIERLKDGSLIRVSVNSIEVNHNINPEAFIINADTIKSIKAFGEEQ